MLLRPDVVSQIPKANVLKSQVIYKNRTNLVHMHNNWQSIITMKGVARHKTEQPILSPLAILHKDNLKSNVNIETPLNDF
jgi:hypothetical protein